MAQIQTYDANPIAAVAPEKTGFSAVGAVLSGIAEPLQKAAQGAVGIIQEREKAQKAADANNLWASSADTLHELNRANNIIRDKYKNAPNPEKMNKELSEEFNRITQPRLNSLDEVSANDYRKAATTAFNKLIENNEDWSIKVADRLAKLNKSRTTSALKRMSDDSAYQAGFTGSDYKVGNAYLLRAGGVRTDLSGNELLTPNKPLDYTTAKLQKDANKNYYLGAIDGMPNIDLTSVDGSVQIGKDKDGNPIVVPVTQYLSEGGELEPNFWKRLKPGRDKPIVKSRIQVGEETIDKYYENLKSQIDADTTLSVAEKKDLKSIAQATADKKKASYKNNEQIISSNISNQIDFAPTFEGIGQELDSMLREDDIFSQAQLFSEENGKFGNLLDNFSAFSLRTQKPKSSVNLFNALLTGNGIEGKYTYEELKKIYAPNNTMQENAFLNKAIQASPYLELDLGENWKNRTQGGNFEESEWFWSKILGLYKMPENTPAERAYKTYKIGEFFLETRKMANNGIGIINKQLQAYADETLLGNGTDSLGFYGKAGVGREMVKMISDVRKQKSELYDDLAPTCKSSEYTADAMESAMNTGLLRARNTLLETGDLNAAQKIIEDTKFKMLQIKYDGIIDINRLEQEKKSGRQPLFTYNGIPWIYEGFNGSEIYVRNGNQRKAL